MLCGLRYLGSCSVLHGITQLCRYGREISQYLQRRPTLNALIGKCLLPGRVLVLGDGNLTFSKSFCSQLRAIDLLDERFLQVVATTYDPEKELVDKYPESAHAKRALRAQGAEVMHGVDAGSLSSNIGTFSIIVFNHPHLGVESAELHKMLLAHTFHSCASALRKDGRMHISLVEGQPRRWKMEAQAHRHGFYLQKATKMSRLHMSLPGYAMRRTHSSKSFSSEASKRQSNYTLHSTLFSFSQSKPLAISSKKLATVCDDPSTSQPRKRRRQLVAAFACQACGKSFTSQQGLRTHTRQVHELGLYKKKPQVCHICSRNFGDKEALQQHVLARHGSDQTIPAHWTYHDRKSFSDQLEKNAPSQYKCGVCSASFVSSTELAAHKSRLVPIVTATQLPCPACTKIFLDERALRQHMNFCQSARKDALLAKSGN